MSNVANTVLTMSALLLTALKTKEEAITPDYNTSYHGIPHDKESLSTRSPPGLTPSLSPNPHLK